MQMQLPVGWGVGLFDMDIGVHAICRNSHAYPSETHTHTHARTHTHAVVVTVFCCCSCRFVDSEGWPTLNAWLAEYKRQNNTSMLMEMLELLQKLPVTIAALKKVCMCPWCDAHSHSSDKWTTRTHKVHVHTSLHRHTHF